MSGRIGHVEFFLHENSNSIQRHFAYLISGLDFLHLHQFLFDHLGTIVQLPYHAHSKYRNPASVRQGHNNRPRILHLQPLQLRRILLMGIYHMSTCIFGFEKSQKSIATDLAAVLPYVIWMFTHCDVPRCLETNLPRCIPHQVYPILRTDITYASINYTPYRDNNCHRDTTSQIWLYNSIITLYQRKV